MTTILFAIGTLTALCSAMALYCLIWERNPGGQPQWEDEDNE